LAKEFSGVELIIKNMDKISSKKAYL
jgi:hypothetical protein